MTNPAPDRPPALPTGTPESPSLFAENAGGPPAFELKFLLTEAQAREMAERVRGQFDKVFVAENYKQSQGTRWKVRGSPGEAPAEVPARPPGREGGGAVTPPLSQVGLTRG